MADRELVRFRGKMGRKNSLGIVCQLAFCFSWLVMRAEAVHCCAMIVCLFVSSFLSLSDLSRKQSSSPIEISIGARSEGKEKERRRRLRSSKRRRRGRNWQLAIEQLGNWAIGQLGGPSNQEAAGSCVSLIKYCFFFSFLSPVYVTRLRTLSPGLRLCFGANRNEQRLHGITCRVFWCFRVCVDHKFERLADVERAFTTRSSCPLIKAIRSRGSPVVGLAAKPAKLSPVGLIGPPVPPPAARPLEAPLPLALAPALPPALALPPLPLLLPLVPPNAAARVFERSILNLAAAMAAAAVPVAVTRAAADEASSKAVCSAGCCSEPFELGACGPPVGPICCCWPGKGPLELARAPWKEEWPEVA